MYIKTIDTKQFVKNDFKALATEIIKSHVIQSKTSAAITLLIKCCRNKNKI